MTEETSQLFASRGLRCTRQRRAIYEALRDSRRHPTADELFRQVCGTGDKAAPKSAVEADQTDTSACCCGDAAAAISLATVYNTVEAFCQAGLAIKLAGAGENGSSRYDAVSEDHLHLRCERTGAVADVPVEMSRQILDHLPSDLLDQIQDRLGFRINHVQIELLGHYQATPEPV